LIISILILRLEYGLLITKKPDNTMDESVSPFLLKEKRLGISFWSIPIFYSFAFKKFHQKDFKSTKEILQLTKVLLLINPENHTAWNLRKENFKELDFYKEIQFLNLLATKVKKKEKLKKSHQRVIYPGLIESGF
jgi:hypothetical protein